MNTDKMTNDSEGEQKGTREKFLTFYLGLEEYGLEILKVQEIIGIMPITRVPRTPESIRGVINLRGRVIPVIDLRLKLGMPAKEDTQETCIVIVKCTGVEIGVVIDRVSEVIEIAGKDIEPAPTFGVQIDTAYLIGIGKAGGTVKFLIQIDKVLSNSDFFSLKSMESEK